MEGVSVIYLQMVDGVCVCVCSIAPGPPLQWDLALTSLLGMVGGGGFSSSPSNELLSSGVALVERLWCV